MFIQIFDFDVYLICIGENKYCTWTKHRSSSTGFSLLISIGLKTSQQHTLNYKMKKNTNKKPDPRPDFFPDANQTFFTLDPR